VKLVTSTKQFIDKTIANFSPYNLLANEIDALSSKLNRKIRVADLGAGPATYWNVFPLQQCLNNCISELFIVDASPEFTKPNEITEFNITYHEGILPKALSEFSEDYFDLVVGLDLIEHFSYEDAMFFLYEIDRITTHTSLIFTPNGLVWQPPSENNTYNAHLSGWTPKIMKSLGWRKSFGHTGFKFFYGPYGIRKKKFNSLTLILHLVTLPIIHFFPRLAFSFSAVKYDKNPRVKLQT
jgi:hypothetical protein